MRPHGLVRLKQEWELVIKDGKAKGGSVEDGGVTKKKELYFNIDHAGKEQGVSVCMSVSKCSDNL